MKLVAAVRVSACARAHHHVPETKRSVACGARTRVMGLQQPSIRSQRSKIVPPCVYSSPRHREESQDLPEVAIAFKHQHLAACVSDTPISPFLLDSADVDHLTWYPTCRELTVSKLKFEDPRMGRARHEQSLIDSDAEAVNRSMAGSVAAIARLMSSCALPSPWEAINMLKMKPELLQMTESDLILRMMSLRRVLTRADLPTIVRRKPGYLVDASVDRRIEHALAVMAKLMPHVDVEAALREQDQVWWTFQTLVESKSYVNPTKPA